MPKNHDKRKICSNQRVNGEPMFKCFKFSLKKIVHKYNYIIKTKLQVIRTKCGIHSTSMWTCVNMVLRFFDSVKNLRQKPCDKPIT